MPTQPKQTAPQAEAAKAEEETAAKEETVETKPPVTGYENYEEPYLAGGVTADVAQEQWEDNVDKLAHETGTAAPAGDAAVSQPQPAQAAALDTDKAEADKKE